VLLGAASGTRAAEGMGIIEEVVGMVLRRFLWIDDLHGVMFRRNWQVLVWVSLGVSKGVGIGLGGSTYI